MASSDPTPPRVAPRRLPSAWTLILVLAVVLAWSAFAAGPIARAKSGAADSRAWEAARVDEGEAIFQTLCAGCHGVRGDGRGPAAYAMDPAPRDLRRGEYRFRSTASGALPERHDILRTLRLGLPGTAMPSWQEQLTGPELRSVVLYLETLSPRFGSEARYAEDILVAPGSLAPPPVTPALLERGRAIYEEQKCGDCHGPAGRGDGISAETHQNSDGTASHVFDFTYGRYKGGSRPEDVYRTFVTGLNGTPMPAFDQSLPEQDERWALVHYVLSLNRARGLGFYLTPPPSWEEPTR